MFRRNSVPINTPQPSPADPTSSLTLHKRPISLFIRTTFDLLVVEGHCFAEGGALTHSILTVMTFTTTVKCICLSLSQYLLF